MQCYSLTIWLSKYLHLLFPSSEIPLTLGHLYFHMPFKMSP